MGNAIFTQCSSPSQIRISTGVDLLGKAVRAAGHGEGIPDWQDESRSWVTSGERHKVTLDGHQELTWKHPSLGNVRGTTIFIDKDPNDITMDTDLRGRRTRWRLLTQDRRVLTESNGVSVSSHLNLADALTSAIGGRAGIDASHSGDVSPGHGNLRLELVIPCLRLAVDIDQPSSPTVHEVILGASLHGVFHSTGERNRAYAGGLNVNSGTMNVAQAGAEARGARSVVLTLGSYNVTLEANGGPQLEFAHQCKTMGEIIDYFQEWQEQVMSQPQTWQVVYANVVDPGHSSPPSATTQASPPSATSQASPPPRHPTAHVALTSTDGRNWSNTPLHLAAHEGHVDVVREICQDPWLLNAKGKEGKTALHLAAGQGHVETVRILCNAGARHDITSGEADDGKTALHMAAWKGHLEVVQILCQQRAVSINTPDLTGKTAVHMAAWIGKEEIVRMLCENGADIGIKSGASDHCKTALHMAAFKGHLEVAQCLYQHRANLNEADLLGRTALHMAAWGGNLELVRFLCEAGADQMIQSGEGDDRKTAVHTAAFKGHREIVDFLCQQGADVNVPDLHGQTPLHMAAKNARSTTISINSFRGADGRTQHTIDFEEQMAGHVGVLQTLCRLGANVNATSDVGKTPLHEAAWSGDAEMVRILCNAGARHDITSGEADDGKTALHMAAWKGHLEVVQILCQQRAVSINTPDLTGRTAVHMAAWNGYNEVVRILHQEGANLEATTVLGETPMHFAAFKGHEQTVRFLRRATSRNPAVSVRIRQSPEWPAPETPDANSDRSGRSGQKLCCFRFPLGR